MDISREGFEGAFAGETRDHLWHQIVRVTTEIGVRVYHEPALRLYAECGAEVDFGHGRVRVGEKLIRKALQANPSDFTLYGKSAAFDLPVTGKSYYTIGGGVGLQFYEGGRVRESRSRDLIELTALQDALEYPDIVNTAVQPSGMPDSLLGCRLFSTVYPRTRKHHFAQAFSSEDLDKIVAVSRIVRGARGLRSVSDFSVTVCLQSPLIHGAMAGQVLIGCAQERIPLFINVSPIQGATSSVSVEGTIAEKFANFLTALVLVQSVAPGTPCIFSSASSLLDLKSARYISFSPIQHFGHEVSAMLARSLGIRYQNSLTTDAKEPDLQYGIQRTLGIMFSVMAGASFSNLQILAQMTLGSKEHIVVDNEIMKTVGSFLQGAELGNGDCVEALKSVAGEGFLSEQGNVEYFKRNVWLSDIFDYKPLAEWLNDRKTVLGAVTHKAESASVARETLEADLESAIASVLGEHQGRPE